MSHLLKRPLPNITPFSATCKNPLLIMLHIGSMMQPGLVDIEKENAL